MEMADDILPFTQPKKPGRKPGVKTRRYSEPPTKPTATTIGKQISPEQARVFWDRRDAGFSVMAASKYANFSYATGLRLNDREEHLHQPQQMDNEDLLTAPKTGKQLSADALRALGDFGFFQKRYFGRIATPWQVMAAEQVRNYLDTEDEEYLVVNAPPGSGKSTYSRLICVHGSLVATEPFEALLVAEPQLRPSGIPAAFDARWSELLLSAQKQCNSDWGWP